jgi:magnesium chelatase family protein
MFTKLTSFATIGLDSEPITVEIGITPGEASMSIVGLGDMAVQESKQRVRHALRASNFRMPTGRAITVNLAPAHLKKVGPRYDLPIALGLIAAEELAGLPENVFNGKAFLGELALDGTLRHVTGILPAALACRAQGITTIVVPAANGPEAALVPDIEVIAAHSLTDVVAILRGDRAPDPVMAPAASPAYVPTVDFADIRGQDHAKRALEIAAAGGHNVLLSGAPGSGKTLLAQALQGILPPLSREESLEVTQIYSVANLLPADTPLLEHRPFRLVHHTASGVSIVGGGQVPGPGEISLAHRGVLFLDELAEFPTQVLEVLRQPLEDRRITISRTQGTVTFPADVLLVAAMNPPQYGGASKTKMQRRISAPLLDRIDLTIDVQPVPIDDLRHSHAPTGDSSATIRERVRRARARQAKRLHGRSISTNKEMGVRDLQELCPLDATCEHILSQAAARLNLSARGYHRTIKVARTIADLSDAERITPAHVAEALQYRQSIGLENA